MMKWITTFLLKCLLVLLFVTQLLTIPIVAGWIKTYIYRGQLISFEVIFSVLLLITSIFILYYTYLTFKSLKIGVYGILVASLFSFIFQSIFNMGSMLGYPIFVLIFLCLLFPNWKQFK